MKMAFIMPRPAVVTRVKEFKCYVRAAKDSDHWVVQEQRVYTCVVLRKGRCG